MAEASEISQPPVDPLHIASHVSVKLTGENYFLWKSELVPVLKTYDLFNIVHRKELCPPKYMSEDKKDENPAYTNWRRRDRTCRVFIYATLSEDMWPLLRSCSRRAHAMWLKLEEEFVAITRPRTRLLKTRLLDLKKGKLTMLKYLEVAEEIADGLAVVGSPLEDWDYAAHVLHGLPSDYDAFSTSIRARDPPITREELRNLLQSEEIIVYKRRQTSARIMPNAASNSSSTVQQQQQRPRPKPPVPRFTQMPENRKDYGVTINQVYDMFNIVQGTERRPPLPQRDQNCLNFIKLTLSEAMLTHAVGCSTARALWLKLEEQGEIARSRLGQMISRLKTLKKGSFMSMSLYYQSAKQIADRLAAAGSPVSDGDFVKHVLNGLPADYASFANLIRARSDAVTPEELHDLLVEQEATRKRELLYGKVIKYGIIVLVSFAVGCVVGDCNGYQDGYRDGFYASDTI